MIYGCMDDGFVKFCLEDLKLSDGRLALRAGEGNLDRDKRIVRLIHYH